MDGVAKEMLLVLMMYMVSPIDAMLGPIDDVIILLIGIAAQKRVLLEADE